VSGHSVRGHALVRILDVRNHAGFLLLAVALCLMSCGQNPLRAESRLANQNAHPIPPPDARVDINHASAAELLKVPGMTATWASRVVRFRPYRTKADLLERGVLTGEVYDRVKDYVIAHREKQ
jgi:DNA uptake protein ComE-like DNA-binding protein